MKKISLTQGKFALVDDKHFDWLNQFKWQAAKTKNDEYEAVRNCWSRIDKQIHTIRMSRQIMSCPQDRQIDHKDHNKLNNQESNLRICTNAENKRNGKKHIDNVSGYKGVIQYRQTKKWIAHITFNGKSIHLGCFDSKSKAAKIYDIAAKKYFGDFALTNF